MDDGMVAIVEDGDGCQNACARVSVASIAKNVTQALI